MKAIQGLALFMVIVLMNLSCTNTRQNEAQAESSDKAVSETTPGSTITEQEVLEAQRIWGEGIVRIGKVYTEEGDYKSEARNHIADLYGYNLGPVLFKPTLAAEKQFRTTKEGALSYFVGNDDNYPEDYGFAIKPWSNVRWESIGVITEGNMAIAMGNYYFTPAKGGDEVKVEYSFAYTKDENGKLRIVMHGSHLPYSPE